METPLHERAKKAVANLRDPSQNLAHVANTIRQSLADIIEEQQKKVDRYGLVLMMIREGAENPRQFARETLEEMPAPSRRSVVGPLREALITVANVGSGYAQKVALEALREYDTQTLGTCDCCDAHNVELSRGYAAGAVETFVCADCLKP